jgi:1-acyl-sn-glycerol-3-phosphate acyltransferase
MTFWYRVGYTMSRLLATLYFRRRVIHPEKLAVPGGCLIVANHTSYLDPPMIGSAFPEEIHYMARKTLFSNAAAKWAYGHCNAIPVDQSRPELSTIKRILHLVGQGEKVLVFPEGERTLDGQLKEKGAQGIGLLIAKSKAPVLPVRMFGAYEAMPRGAKVPRPRQLTLVVGDLLDLNHLLEHSGLSGKELYQELSDRAMEAIAALKLPEDEGPAGGEG